MMGMLSSPVYPRAWVLRTTGTFGKDVLRGARVAGAIGAMMVMIWAVTLAFGESMRLAPQGVAIGLWQVYMPVAAYVIGLILAGEDEESDARFFVDRLPVRPFRLVMAKLAAGAGVWVLAVVLLAIFLEMGVGLLGPAEFLEKALNYKTDVPGTPLWRWLTAQNGAGWCATLLLTGLAVGSLARRQLLVMGVIGYAVMVGWLYLLYPLAEWKGHQALHGDRTLRPSLLFLNERAGWLGMPLWDCLAFGVTVWRFHARREIEESRWTHLWARGSAPGGLGATVSTMAHRDALRWGVGFMGLMATSALVEVRVFESRGDVLLAAIFCLVVAVIYGVLAHPACETDGTTFFLHTLPVQPARFLGHRLARIGLLAAAATVAWLLVLAVAWRPLPGDAVQLSLATRAMLPFATGTTDGTFLLVALAFGELVVAMAWLGYLVRGFFRQPVVAVVMGLTTAVPWVVAGASVALLATWMLPWAGLVALVLAGGAVWIAERHSLLPELNDGARAGAGIFAVVNLAVWGPLLMTMWPLDLVRMIF